MPSILSLLLSLIKPMYDFLLQTIPIRTSPRLQVGQFHLQPSLSLQADEASVWHWSSLGWTIKGHIQCRWVQNSLQRWGISESKENKSYVTISYKNLFETTCLGNSLCPDYCHCQRLRFSQSKAIPWWNERTTQSFHKELIQKPRFSVSKISRAIPTYTVRRNVLPLSNEVSGGAVVHTPGGSDEIPNKLRQEIMVHWKSCCKLYIVVLL